jgi:hypothetical protein
MLASRSNMRNLLSGVRGLDPGRSLLLEPKRLTSNSSSGQGPRRSHEGLPIRGLSCVPPWLVWSSCWYVRSRKGRPKGKGQGILKPRLSKILSVGVRGRRSDTLKQNAGRNAKERTVRVRGRESVTAPGPASLRTCQAVARGVRGEGSHLL